MIKHRLHIDADCLDSLELITELPFALMPKMKIVTGPSSDMNEFTVLESKWETETSTMICWLELNELQLRDCINLERVEKFLIDCCGWTNPYTKFKQSTPQ